MLDFPRWKVWLVSLTLVFGILYAIPSLLPERITDRMPGWSSPRINLGLDLAGGSQLLLEAETSGLARQRLETMEDQVSRALRRESVRIGDVSTSGGQVSFMVRDARQVDQAVEIARSQSGGAGLTGQRDWDVRVVDTSRIVMTQTQAGLEQAVDDAIDTAREVIDRRINALGTLEPTILREGSRRILVQVPGLEDPEALKSLIGRTARLEFKMVDEEGTRQVLSGGPTPVGVQVLPYPEAGEGARIALQRRAIITGDQITGARQGFDPRDNRPVVNIQFDGAGSQRFARVTRENVGKRFAMVLDDVVLSAPSINEPIPGGQAQISGSFTVESANELAISLRSGRLPVELTVVQESSVGPDLGAESIRLGAIAMAIGTSLVLIYMFLTYGRFGLYADSALILNVALILAAMAIMNATLTLPGIAGFVLTIGAAVDANVIVNERIREEQRRGRNVYQAIEHGYNEARSAIFDANVTNVIAGMLLFYFGSGPVRGFAVVMVIGIITSVFTAVTVTRMFVSFWLRKRPKELVI